MYKLAKLEYKTQNFLVIQLLSDSTRFSQTVQTELREGGSGYLCYSMALFLLLEYR